MLTPKELSQKIETTSLVEAIELFKEKVLNVQLTHYVRDDYMTITTIRAGRSIVG